MSYFCDDCDSETDCWCRMCHICDDVFGYDNMYEDERE